MEPLNNMFEYDHVTHINVRRIDKVRFRRTFSLQDNSRLISWRV